MLVTIVVPTLNAAEYVPGFISGLVRQSFQPDRVIFIDSSSKDGSDASWAQAGYEVVKIPQATFDHGGTRNLGASLAGTGICCFFTQDAVLSSPETLKNLVTPLLTGEVAASYGRQLPRPGAKLGERYARFFQYKAQSERHSVADVSRLGVRAYRFTNVCSAVRLDKFWQVGGFPERVILNEDMILAARLIQAGEIVEYIGNAEVIHSHNYDLVQQFQRNFDIGVSFREAGPLLRAASTSGEGLRFALGQMQYLASFEAWSAMPPAFLDLLARWVGFQLGKNHRYIGIPLKKHLSMHKYYWQTSEVRD